MTNPVLVVSGPYRRMWCPGCDDVHQIGDGWGWNGSLDRPTFTPSILVTGGPVPGRRCHSFLTDGVWDFLGDSTHALAGSSAAMVPVPDWVLAEPGGS